MISESDSPPVAAPTNAGGAVTVHVVGELQAFSPPAVFTGCRFYVPFSAGANALSPPVDWNSRTAADRALLPRRPKPSDAHRWL